MLGPFTLSQGQNVDDRIKRTLKISDDHLNFLTALNPMKLVLSERLIPLIPLTLLNSDFGKPITINDITQIAFPIESHGRQNNGFLRSYSLNWRHCWFWILCTAKSIRPFFLTRNVYWMTCTCVRFTVPKNLNLHMFHMLPTMTENYEHTVGINSALN